MRTGLELYKRILESITDGVYFLDVDRKITYWNHGAERISGYSATELVGASCADNMLVHVDDKGTHLCLNGCPVTATLHDGQVHEAEVYLHHKYGYRVPVKVQVSPIRDGQDRIIGAIEIFKDNSAREYDRQTVESLKKAALLDPLTGLVNRRSIEMKLSSAFSDMDRHDVSFGVVFADIDFFKKVNDTYGHGTGDEVLNMVANTLSSNMRVSDMVGRWGGEEFVAIIAHADTAQLRDVSDKLRVLVESSFLQLAGKQLNVTLTLGCTMACKGDNAESLIERADQLLYKGKLTGRNCVVAG